MSRENVEAVRRGYDAVRRRDIHSLLALFDPEVEAVSHVMAAEGTVYRGLDGIRQQMEDIWSVFPDWHADVIGARDMGDAVVVELQMTGRGVASGMHLEQTAWQVLRFRSGKVVSMRGYATEAEALEAVGLQE